MKANVFFLWLEEYVVDSCEEKCLSVLWLEMCVMDSREDKCLRVLWSEECVIIAVRSNVCVCLVARSVCDG